MKVFFPIFSELPAAGHQRDTHTAHSRAQRYWLVVLPIGCCSDCVAASLPAAMRTTSLLCDDGVMVRAPQGHSMPRCATALDAGRPLTIPKEQCVRQLRVVANKDAGRSSELQFEHCPLIEKRHYLCPPEKMRGLAALALSMPEHCPPLLRAAALLDRLPSSICFVGDSMVHQLFNAIECQLHSLGVISERKRLQTFGGRATKEVVRTVRQQAAGSRQQELRFVFTAGDNVWRRAPAATEGRERAGGGETTGAGARRVGRALGRAGRSARGQALQTSGRRSGDDGLPYETTLSNLSSPLDGYDLLRSANPRRGSRSRSARRAGRTAPPARPPVPAPCPLPPAPCPLPTRGRWPVPGAHTVCDEVDTLVLGLGYLHNIHEDKATTMQTPRNRLQVRASRSQSLTRARVARMERSKRAGAPSRTPSKDVCPAPLPSTRVAISVSHTQSPSARRQAVEKVSHAVMHYESLAPRFRRAVLFGYPHAIGLSDTHARERQLWGRPHVRVYRDPLVADHSRDSRGARRLFLDASFLRRLDPNVSERLHSDYAHFCTPGVPSVYADLLANLLVGSASGVAVGAT